MILGKSHSYVLGNKIPEFCKSHWLLRLPLIIVFLQQGLSKIPVSSVDAESFALPILVWFFVAWGEVLAGVGITLGGLLEKKWFGDFITRMAGFIITSIMLGVILIGEPESILDVILYDQYHVMLFVGGLFFTLRGNRA